MARGAIVKMDELPEDRLAEIAEQARRHEEEAQQWQDLFNRIDSEILSPKMNSIASDLDDAGKWMGDKPETYTRLSGTGVKSDGKFQGVVDGRERPVEFSVELYPSTNGKFIAYLDVNGHVERETYVADSFESESEESDDKNLTQWLDSQLERHVRTKALA